MILTVAMPVVHSRVWDKDDEYEGPKLRCDDCGRHYAIPMKIRKHPGNLCGYCVGKYLESLRKSKRERDTKRANEQITIDT